eukprot:463708-Rhodomonas_salina.1
MNSARIVVVSLALPYRLPQSPSSSPTSAALSDSEARYLAQAESESPSNLQVRLSLLGLSLLLTLSHSGNQRVKSPQRGGIELWCILNWLMNPPKWGSLFKNTLHYRNGCEG